MACDIERIKELLPHRKPFLFVDSIDEADKEHVIGRRKFTEDDFFFQGHFPQYPVVPGVILCEIMAQSSCILVKDYLAGKTPMYTGIEKARFKSSVRPGDKLDITAKVIMHRGPLFMIDAKAKVGDRLCCEGTLSFLLVPNEHLNESK